MIKKSQIAFLCILNVLRSVLLVGQAIISKLLVDAAVNNGEWLLYTILLISFVLLNVILGLIVFAYRNKISLKIEVDMKQHIYNALIGKDVNDAKQYHSGELSNVYLSDIQNIKNGICETIPSIFLHVSRFILAFAAIIWLDYRLLLILLILGILAIIAARIYSNIMKKYHKLGLESDGKVNAFMQESFENIRIVKATNSEERVKDGLKDRLKENWLIKNKRNNISLFGTGGLFVLMEITMLITMVYGAYGLATSLITYGTLTGLLQVVGYFESPLSMLSSLLNRYNAYRTSEERIQKIYDLKDDVVQEDLTSFDSIIFNNVSFSYDFTVLKNVNLEINPGDTILLKGPSGSGKSTMFNLLLGFIVPDEGEIKAIVNNEELPIYKCRKLFSYVAQENILFSGSIRENFKLFVDDITDEQIYESLKISCVYDEIMAKPSKLDTILNERGGGLSLGQIQRILLAVALLKNNPILLLDEFTSALDKELEKNIVINVSKLNKTKIIITHRDIELDNAKVVKIGVEDGN